MSREVLDPRSFDLIQVEDRLWIVTAPTGLRVYDYDLTRYFQCKHGLFRHSGIVTAVARMGAAPDYGERFRSFLEMGIRLIHEPEEYLRTSYLPNWYPLIRDFTPRSRWFETPPTVEQIEQDFSWPIFVKGERQTSKHQAKLAFIENPKRFEEVMDLWRRDPILHWQRVVVRDFIPLRPASPGGHIGSGLPKSFEFRCFVWKGTCVGIGRYWTAESYELDTRERDEVTALAERVAATIRVTFLVVDVAMTLQGEWTVIEINDGQDSGYAGNQPLAIWRRILDLEA